MNGALAYLPIAPPNGAPQSQVGAAALYGSGYSAAKPSRADWNGTSAARVAQHHSNGRRTAAQRVSRGGEGIPQRVQREAGEARTLGNSDNVTKWLGPTTQKAQLGSSFPRRSGHRIVTAELSQRGAPGRVSHTL